MFSKKGQKENQKRKQNRKERRISKTGLLGTQKRKKTLKLQDNSIFVFVFPNKKLNTKKKTKPPNNKNKQTKKQKNMLANTHLFLVNFCFFKLHSFISAKLCSLKTQ